MILSRLAAGWLAVAGLLVGAAAASSCTVEAYCFGCEGEGGGAPTSSSSSGDGGAGGAAACDLDDECQGEELCCLGGCADVLTDELHCGECGKPCDPRPNATVVCDEGECALACNAGSGDCNFLQVDGCEAPLVSDPKNCGECGTVCLLANAVPGCEDSMCTISSCKQGFADCDGVLMNGCETNLGSDPLHCNGCANACPAPPNAEPLCLAGRCSFGGCLPGFGDCNGMPADGCEIDLLTDTQHCGSCPNVCPPVPNAIPDCVGGICGVGACDAGYDDCDTSVWSGCETLLASSVAHCGACNAACPALPQATPKCEDSACAIGLCAGGYDDCDGLVPNGCEVNLANTVSDCGACGNACAPIINGSPTCVGYQCVIGACDAGFDDCFGGSTDGCETDLLTDVNHCGDCVTVCPPVANGAKACSAGVCAIESCSPGFADCNGLYADGCETSLLDNPASCGMCGFVCPVPANGNAGCSAGMCNLSGCAAGFSNCDGDPSNGCEFDTTSDPNNCGGCGIKCGSGSCVASECACVNTVLLVRDDSPAGSAVLANALTAAGYAVTQTAVPAYQYNGTNPPPAGFGVIVVLSGGPGSPSFTTDMPAAGQTAILNHVNTGGNGLVLTEWAAYQVAGNRWQTLKPLVLLQRTAAYSGQVTYTIDPAFAAHPVWATLPASFTFASTSNVGSTKVAPGVATIATSVQAVDAVAIRDVPVGRVVHVAHAGNYAPNGWTNTNIQKLISNAVGWAARCD